MRYFMVERAMMVDGVAVMVGDTLEVSDDKWEPPAEGLTPMTALEYEAWRRWFQRPRSDNP